MFEIEKDFQNEIANNHALQKDICAVLGLEFESCDFVREDKYINGISADFSLFCNGKVAAIMECKGGQIGVTDYVRGIGQIFQYEYFAEQKVSSKNYDFVDIGEFSSVYIFPDLVLRNNDFNVGLFKYPKSKKILEVNSNSLAVRLIGEKELEKMAVDRGLKSRKLICQYYIHDTRIFELYYLLKIIATYQMKSKNINRKDIENSLKDRVKTINSGGWRNAFITLSSLGFINKDGLSEAGFSFANKGYDYFAYAIFKYLEPFFSLLIEILKENGLRINGEINISNGEIFDLIIDKYGEIRFLAEITNKDSSDNTRYISSYLNLLRDDFAIFNFSPRSNLKKFLFDPTQSTDKAFKDHIKQYSKINNFKQGFEGFINEI